MSCEQSALGTCRGRTSGLCCTLCCLNNSVSTIRRALNGINLYLIFDCCAWVRGSSAQQATSEASPASREAFATRCHQGNPCPTTVAVDRPKHSKAMVACQGAIRAGSAPLRARLQLERAAQHALDAAVANTTRKVNNIYS